LQETSGRHLQVASSSELRLSANSRTTRNFAALFQSAVSRLACAAWHVSCAFYKDCRLRIN
jgi:hypothetical protein